MVSLRSLLTASPLCEPCRIDDALNPGDVAECGCIIASNGRHFPRGEIWVSTSRIAAARYYGWRPGPWTIYTLQDGEMRSMRR